MIGEVNIMSKRARSKRSMHDKGKCRVFSHKSYRKKKKDRIQNHQNNELFSLIRSTANHKFHPLTAINQLEMNKIRIERTIARFNWYRDMIKSNTLPEGFNRWDIADEDGWSLAHEYVCYRELPAGFSQWELSDLNGRTVAHVAAEYGGLLEDFNQWKLCDNFGQTVSYIAAAYGNLPAGFSIPHL